MVRIRPGYAAAPRRAQSNGYEMSACRAVSRRHPADTPEHFPSEDSEGQQKNDGEREDAKVAEGIPLSTGGKPGSARSGRRTKRLRQAPDRLVIGVRSNGDGEAGRQPAERRRVLLGVLPPRAAEPKNGHLIEAPIRFRPVRPGNITVRLTGFRVLLVDEQKAVP